MLSASVLSKCSCNIQLKFAADKVHPVVPFRSMSENVSENSVKFDGNHSRIKKTVIEKQNLPRTPPLLPEKSVQTLQTANEM